MHVFLETERLVLRRFTSGDVDNLVELDGDPEVMRYLTGGRPTPAEEIRDDYLPAFLRLLRPLRRLRFCAAIEKATGEFLGWFHFRPQPSDAPDDVELGYRLRKVAWGKGYGTEGSRALIDKGFTEFGVRHVYAQTMAVNAGSRRVMEKSELRFVKNFDLCLHDPIPGTEHSEVEYALTREEWATR